MKRLLLLLLTFLSITTHAQIESHCELYYVPSGESVQDNPYIFIFKVVNNYVYETPGWKKESVSNQLKKDSEYYYNLSYREGFGNCYYHKGEYLPDMSIGKYEVYGQRCSLSGGRYYWHYWAFSKDAKYLIRWDEEENGGYLNGGKRYYVRISKEDLLPKTVNHDFLYE